ncbi:hypothetical protein [Streptomyces kanasensis]|uniref:Uncharacterized protein n=1 Tax=Streptomyces kanasensis TaxID=936756 RepID=A0A100Y0A7_9ACTN|nr:hypothetical protein [Streptomyces kanasensis]KUH35344.1 hypothetical protein ATE80_29730 [Streptomyces kanasensis]
MPATPTLTSHRPSADEVFDAETLALLEELDVPLSADFDVDLDVAFGTPLEMYELATANELVRWDAANAVTKGKVEARAEFLAEYGARHDAKRHILAADPSITALVRERLVDVLLPYADRLRRTIRSGCRPEYAAA